ncbi:MAG: PEP-CTERM sorting domain-containing protein [Armatimonadetes bacterium]|nr:PEP-CTERM sorting domain-containing protein [Armatimonadota bacterium]
MPIVKKLSDFSGEQVKQMRTNRGWLTGILVGGVALSLVTTGHAQTGTIDISLSSVAKLYSSGGVLLNVNTPAVSVPSITVQIGPTFSGIVQTGSFNAFATAATIEYLAGTQPVNVSVANGAAGGLGDRGVTVGNLFSGTGSVQQGFTAFFPASGSNFAQFTASSSPVIITSGDYRLVLTPSDSSVGSSATPATIVSIPTETWSYSFAIVPEPATFALFSLGLAPIAVAIRRRRK